jgi:hypothetical protein
MLFAAARPFAVHLKTMNNSVQVQATSQQVRQAVVDAIAAATGSGPDQSGLARGIALAVGMEALSIIRNDFLVRARGGTDASGLKWKPLQPATIAARRPPSQKKRGERPRGLLSAKQDERWRKLYSAALRWMKGDQGHAAAWAWATLKAEGAPTRLEKLGSRQVEIGRDTGRMFNSLSPGMEDNVLQPEPGHVTIGTNVKYAGRFHEKRPLWAEPEQWPVAYWDRLGKVARDGIQLLVQANLGRSG